MNHRFNSFARAALADLPTPVVRLEALGRACGHDRLFMKRDDLSGPVYGGNKIRKLEFLLGEALSQQRKSVITFGAAGSNHALATAICCRQIGLRAELILTPQPMSEHVRRNLQADRAVGAQIHRCERLCDVGALTDTVRAACLERDGIEPWIIPPGGSNALGALGFAAAALELTGQIRPDVIYLPMGTGGTYAGLLTGFLLTDHRPRIEAIRVVDAAFRNERHLRQLCDELCDLLGIRERVDDDRLVIRDGFLGTGYGAPTPEGAEAVEQFQALENIALEQTYTGKTVAALLHDLRSGRLDGQTVLYWNTLNSRDLSAILH